MEGWKANSRER